MKKFTILLVLVLWTSTAFSKTIFQIDFTKEKPTINGKTLLKKLGFQSRYDFKSLHIKNTKDGLVFNPANGGFAFFLKKFKPLYPVGKIRITWYFTYFPKGSHFGANSKRQLLGINVSFGTKTFSSGRFYVPDLPYFIGILVNNLDKNEVFLPSYYKDSGRYMCYNCPVKTNQWIVTIVDLKKEFSNLYGASNLVPISSIGIEIDLRNVSLKHSEYKLKKIELLDK